MAFVPGFEYDIFISYAHLNDPPGEDSSARWVTRFHQRLEAGLRQLTNKPLRIWRDPHLGRNQEFDKTIKDAVENAALFLALNSFAYHASANCQDEVQWFYDRAQLDGWGVSIGDRRRFFNVLLNNIPPTEWHQAFAGTSGYSFFEEKPGRKIALPCDQGSKYFQQQLDDLVIELFETLDACKRTALKKQPPPAASLIKPANGSANSTLAPPAGAGFTVFLAETADPLRKRRQLLATELQARGVKLAATIPPPWEVAQHDEEFIAATQQANLCLHLLGAWPGREVDGAAGEDYTRRQIELGQAHQRPQLIWVPSTLLAEDLQTVEDEDYRAFLKQLRDGKREQASYCFVSESPATLTQVVLDRLAELQRAQTLTSASASVLIDTHFKDEDYADALRSRLRGLGVRSILNQGEGDPHENVEILEMRLRKLPRMLIVFGNVEADWVLGRLTYASEIANREKLPLKVGIYYTGARRKGNGGQIKFGSLTVYEFDDTDFDDDPPTLRSWLA